MKQKSRHYVSMLFYALFGFFFLFLIPSHISAQNADCDSQIPHTSLPVYFYDQRGVRFGEIGNSCVGSQGTSISRVSGIKNTYFTCSENNGSVSGAFIARTYRCTSGTMIFDHQVPAPFAVSKSSWKYVGVGSGFGNRDHPNLNPPVTGNGSRITVPYPPNDWARQVIITMNLPDPNRLSYTCNNNQTVTLRWSGVTGATEYGWRLDNQANAWYTSSTDTFGYTGSTSATVSLRYGQTYKWAMTATNSAGRHPTTSSWSANFSCPPPPPANQNYTCNANGTATFSWNGVTGASSYIPRLNRITSPDNWRNLGQGDTGANAPGITATSATYPLRDASSYGWAVSSVASGVEGAWSWLPVSCITIRTQNSVGTAVSVRGMGYTYNACGSTRTCIGSSSQNSNTGSFRTIPGWQGGAGIALNANQRIIGINPAPAGGSLVVRAPNDPSNAAWQNQVTWNNYWWNPYPANGVRSVAFVVATTTPTPTATPPLSCGTITNTSGTGARVGPPTAFTGRISGISTTTTGCDLRIDGVSADTGNSVGNPRRCDMSTNVRTGSHSYNIRATGAATSLSCRTVTFCGDSTAPAVPGNRVLTCAWAGTNGGGTNLYNLGYSYTGVVDSGCIGMSSTPYWAQISNNPAFATTLNADNTWQGGAAGLTTSATNVIEGTTIRARVRSRDALDNQSAWSAISSFVLNSTNCTGVPTPTAVPPTPTPAYWFKLRDSSFNRVTNSTYLRVPNNALRFSNTDADDPNPAATQLIMGANGLITSNSNITTINGGGTFSTTRAYKNNYSVNRRHLQDAATMNTFKDSLRDTKDAVTITTMAQVQANKVNIREGSLTINSALPAGQYVIFVNGNVNINPFGASTIFNPANQSIAIIATGTIFIHQNFTVANGIFVANTVQLTSNGVVTPQLPTLKINGNLISITSVNDTIRLSTNQRAPSLFVVFKPQMYLDLLPLLSTTVQEGRQLE